MNAAGYLLFAGADEVVALECGKVRISYGELRVAVRRAAGAWRARGLGQGERVLVFAPDGIEWVIAYLGAIWAGGVAVGLNSRLFEKDLRVVLNESGARFIWCSAGSQALLGGLLAGAAEAPTIVIDSDWATGLGEASQILAHDQPEDAPALWIYTSGTTGIPKAVVHAQRCVLDAGTFAREVLGLGPGDRIYATSKLFFAYALGNNLFGGLIEIAVFAVATPGREQEADLSLCAGIEALPKIKRPRLVKWVQELPLTATGKLQRRKLKDLILSA